MAERQQTEMTPDEMALAFLRMMSQPPVATLAENGPDALLMTMGAANFGELKSVPVTLVIVAGDLSEAVMLAMRGIISQDQGNGRKTLIDQVTR